LTFLLTDNAPGATEFSPTAIARRVMMAESQALAVMAEQVGGDFVAAVEALARITGRIIVTGMGKSGHIGRKIAATMASTGSPAQFVHPAEASHGDLGMVMPADALLALSNSGNTVELADVLAHGVRLRIPVIAITSRKPSLLSDAATITLLLPNAPEACPLQLAPTTSTTMAMAMGDALAVALLERRGFSPDDFHSLHPGGMLGRRLLRVADIMHASPPLVSAETTMDQAVVAMTAQSFGCVGVTDTTGKLIGVVTDGDLRRNMSADLLRRPAEAIMSSSPKTIRPGALAAEALAIMNESGITSLFVAEDDQDGVTAVGIVHVHDCLRAGLT
jgi:arabinose-5-phosphate isomerase